MDVWWWQYVEVLLNTLSMGVAFLCLAVGVRSLWDWRLKWAIILFFLAALNFSWIINRYTT